MFGFSDRRLAMAKDMSEELPKALEFENGPLSVDYDGKARRLQGFKSAANVDELPTR